MKVKDIATSGVAGMAVSSSVAEAATTLYQEEIGALVIHQDARPVGVFTEHDLVRAIADKADIEGTRVSDYMTGSPVSVDEETSLELAIGEMDKWAVRHLAVTRDDQIVGMISARDVIHALAPKSLSGK